MNRVTMMMAAASLLGITAPAIAVQYRFDVVDPMATTPDGTSIDDGAYFFFFDSSPHPTIYTTESFSLDGTVFYTVGGVGSSTSGPFSFLTSNSFGGLSTPLAAYSGDQLFSGTTDDPTFLTGGFAIDTATITISPVGGMSAAPEPASWGLMIAGFGMIGATLRARRRTVRFA